MGNTFGTIFRITTWGESHGKAVGAVVDGCPAGLALSEADIQKELDRRKPGQSKVASARQEFDKAQILSGVFKGRTLGTPVSILVENCDVRPSSYQNLKDVYRPGHADFTWEAKYGIRDWRGGGRASGRETVARVAGGAVAKKLLGEIGVEIVGFVRQIGNVILPISNFKFLISNQIPNSKSQIPKFRQKIEKSIIRCPDEEISKKMIELIEEVKKDGDSVGGVVEVVAVGVPAGWGEPVFGKLSARLAGALMSIPGVKGIEIGSGFACAKMRGSEHNDSVKSQISNLKSQKFGIKTITNNAGGILGGISNGMPIVARIAVKPTSSIAKEQETVNSRGRRKKIKIKGRHDPCICPRVVPVAEAMMALVLVDCYFYSRLSRL